MKIERIIQVLGAEMLCGEELLQDDIQAACGSDLMSDVLAFVEGHTVLLTGMTNPHALTEQLAVKDLVFTAELVLELIRL